MVQDLGRSLHIYDKGDMVTLRKPGSIFRTLVLPQQGPYKVLKHHVNGSIQYRSNWNKTLLIELISIDAILIIQ